jgi:hypothetical protein
MTARPRLIRPSAAQISLWIRDLASPKSVVRKDAWKRLIAAGDQSVPALQSAIDKPGLPQRGMRIHALLKTIALADALRGPMVTLRGDHCALRDVIASVCSQAGLACQLPRHCRRLSKRFEINIRHQLFWKVLVRIAQVTGISPEAQLGPSPGLEFSRHGLFATGTLVAVNGSFAMAIESASVHDWVKPRAKPGRDEHVVKLVCNTLWLPVKKDYEQMGAPQAESARVGKLRTFPVHSNLFSIVHYGMATGEIISGYPGTLTIGPMTNVPRTISRLVFRAPVAISMHREFQSANHLDSGHAEIDADGMRFMFGRPRRVGPLWGVSMNVITPPWLAKSLPVRSFLSRMGFFPHGPFFFTNARGNLIGHPNGFGHGYVTKAQYEFFPLRAKPAGVFVKTYSRLAAADVQFIFRNIPIPLAKAAPPADSISQPPIRILESIKVRSQAPTTVTTRQLVMLPGPPPVQSSKPEIATWINALIGHNRAASATATRELISSGDSAVPALKLELNGWTTPRMRRQIRYVLGRISQQDALRGPLVTLKVNNAPLREILKRLCAQAGFSAQFAQFHLAPAVRHLTVNIERQPFWKVIDGIERITDISPEGNDYWGNGFLTFYQPGVFARRTPVCTHGALLLAVDNVSAGQTISFDAKPAQRLVGGFSLRVTGFWALGHSQIVRLGPAHFITAIDNHGQSLLAAPTAPVDAYCPTTQYDFSFGPRLLWPHAGGTEIRLLKGELPITLAEAPRTEQVRHLNSGRALIDSHGVRIRIAEPTDFMINPTNPLLDRCAVHFSIASPANAAGNPMTKFFMQSLPVDQSFAYTPSIGGVLGFKTKSGRPLSCRIWKQANGAGWSYEIYVRGGLPTTVWAKFYNRFVRVQIPFSFHNLPIPNGAGRELRSLVPWERDALKSHKSNSEAPVPSSTDAVTTVELEHWVRQLGSSNVTRRRTAARSLISGGNAAIPLIQKALGQPIDPVTRQQFISILDTIAAARDLRGPLVSLNVKHASVRKSLVQLCSEIGMKAQYDSGPEEHAVTIHVRHLPFWTALRHIAARTHIGPMGQSMSGNYPLQFGYDNIFARGVPVVIHGACAMAIQSIRRLANRWLVPVNPANKKRYFSARVDVLWAPTSRQILEQVGSIHATEIITDLHGHRLLTRAVKTSRNIWPRRHADALFPMKLHLRWPPANAAEMELRGTLRMYLSSDETTQYCRNLGSGLATLTVEGMNLKFHQPQRIPGGWNMRLDIGITQGFSYQGKTSHWLAFAQMPIEHRFTDYLFSGNELQLYDATGHRLNIVGHSGGLNASRGWGYYRYNIKIAGAMPKRAAIRFFTRTVAVKVPFDFKNLPIPG